MPPGEAPLNVRQAWVGLTLPVIGGPQRILTWGVATGRKPQFGCILGFLAGRLKLVRGYLVDSRVAIEIPTEAHPEAAAWWRVNAPAFVNGSQSFGFDENVCKLESDGDSADVPRPSL